MFNEEEQFKQKGHDGLSYVHSNIQVTVKDKNDKYDEGGKTHRRVVW